MGVQQKNTPYTSALPKLAASGHSLTEAASVLGLSVDSVRAAKNRLGIDGFQHHVLRDTDIKTQLAGLTDREAIEFLLEVISQMRTAMKVVDTDLAEQFGLSFLENRLLCILMRSEGRVVSKESIYNGLYYDRDPNRLPQIGTISVHAHKLRQKLPPGFGRIDTVHKFGWRFSRTGTDGDHP